MFFELSALFPLFPGENEKNQMNKIHKILGTPSESAMAFFKKHQSRHMSFSWAPQKGTGFKSLIPHVPADFRDLLEGMLQYDPRKRISAHDAVRHKYFDDLWDTPLPPELQDQGGVKSGTKADEGGGSSDPSSKKTAAPSSGEALKVQSTSAQPVRSGLDSPESVRSEVQGGSKTRPSGGGDSPLSDAFAAGDSKYDEEEFESSVASGSTPKHGKGASTSLGGGHSHEASSVHTSLQLSGLKSLDAREGSYGGEKKSGGTHSKKSGGGMSYLSGGKGGYAQSTHHQAHRHTHGSSQAGLQPLSGSSLGGSHSSSKGGSSAYLDSLTASGQKRHVAIKKVNRGAKGVKAQAYGHGSTAASGSSRSSGGGTTSGGGASAAELAARHKQLMRKTRKGTVSSKVASKHSGGSRLVPETFSGAGGGHSGLGAIGGALGASPSAATVGGGYGGARSTSYEATSHVQSQPVLSTAGHMNLAIGGGGFGGSPKRAAGGAKYSTSALRQGGISTGALGMARRTQGSSQLSAAGAAGGSPLRSSGGGKPSYAAMGAVRSSSGVQGFNAGAANKYFGGGAAGYGGNSSGYGNAPKSSAGIGSSYHRTAGGAHRTVNLRLGAPKSSAGPSMGTLGRLTGAPGSSAGVGKYRLR